MARKFECMTTSQRAKSKRQPWIGLVHVKPNRGDTVLGSAHGAYGAVLALASNGDEFGRLVAVYMTSNDLRIIEIEDTEPLAERLQASSPDAAILALAASLSSAEPVIVDCFDTYADDDEPSEH